jgi:hypothetical protein
MGPDIASKHNVRYRPKADVRIPGIDDTACPQTGRCVIGVACFIQQNNCSAALRLVWLESQEYVGKYIKDLHMDEVLFGSIKGILL